MPRVNIKVNLRLEPAALFILPISRYILPSCFSRNSRTMTSKLTLLLIAAMISAAHCGQRIDIVLSGRDIPSNDIIWGETEPYIKVYYKFDNSQNYISYGQTTVSKGNPNPDWPQVFSFDYTGGNTQIAKFDMYDDDVFFDDSIGLVEIPLGEIVSSALANAGMVQRNFAPEKRGSLLMKVRIDGVIPSAVDPINPVVALLTNKH